MITKTSARALAAATKENNVAKASDLDCVPPFKKTVGSILFSLDGSCCGSGYGHFLNRRMSVNAELVSIAFWQLMESLAVVPMAKIVLACLMVAVDM